MMTGPAPSALQKLEAQASRLEASIFFLVALIALAPPVLVFLAEARSLRSRSSLHAEHVAGIVDLYGSSPSANAQGLLRHLRAEFERGNLAWLQVVDAEGQERLTLGEPPSAWVPATVSIALPPSAAPYVEVRARADDHGLGRDLLRLVGIHLMVGLVLGLGIYRIPVRAFGRAIEELESAQAQLVHSNRLSALGSMYAGLAHEINNPLGIVQARVRLLLDDGAAPLPEEARRDLAVIDRQTARIGEIMRSLLAFARKAEFSRRPTDLSEVAREVVALVEKPFSKQGITVQAELAKLPAVQGSPDHLQQVLLNLVTNARDAMPGGGRLVVRTLSRDGRAVAEVQDTGPGLAPEVQARLFEPFFTTKDVGKGTGLGLSVSHGIVAAHGGTLDAMNAPGGGALFRMALPVAS